MRQPAPMASLLPSFSLLDASGALIIAAILSLLVLGVAAIVVARARYAQLRRELLAFDPQGDSSAPVLARAAADLGLQLERLPAGADPGAINVQSIVERAMQQELRGLLLAERFVAATTGLLITLGLVGTFYGLTTSIGKLVGIVSGDLSPEANVAESLTRGLTDALSGMSVAFTTSLVGILAAVAMTLLGVGASIAEQRASFMAQFEHTLDTLVAAFAREHSSTVRDEQLMSAATKLEESLTRFEMALTRFADNTRDFHEFNAHLKDNIQRMSLSFADLSQQLSSRLPSRNTNMERGQK